MEFKTLVIRWLEEEAGVVTGACGGKLLGSPIIKEEGYSIEGMLSSVLGGDGNLSSIFLCLVMCIENM